MGAMSREEVRRGFSAFEVQLKASVGYWSGEEGKDILSGGRSRSKGMES